MIIFTGFVTYLGMILIIFIFTLNCFLNIRWLIINKHKRYSYAWIIVLNTIGSLLWSISYVYTLLSKLFPETILSTDPQWYGAIVVRPIVLFTGLTYVFSGIMRLSSKRHEEESYAKLSEFINNPGK
jgi:hypothetical protein